MARKKTSDGDNLKILDLPKRKPKFITSDEWAEISKAAMCMSLNTAQVEVLIQQADKAKKFSDDLTGDFYAAKKLCDTQQQIFVDLLRKIFSD